MPTRRRSRAPVPLPIFADRLLRTKSVFLHLLPVDCVHRVLSCSNVFCHIYLESFLFARSKETPTVCPLPAVPRHIKHNGNRFQKLLASDTASVLYNGANDVFTLSYKCHVQWCPLFATGHMLSLIYGLLLPVLTKDYLAERAGYRSRSPWAAVEVITQPGVSRLLCYLLSRHTHRTGDVRHIAGAACAAGDELPLNGILRVATATSCSKRPDAINEAKEMKLSGGGRNHARYVWG